MDGAPVFSIGRCGYPGAKITSITGILNSTTNLIISRMEKGDTQEAAIQYAQELGIAETDPSGDIDGWDAAIKIAALVTVLMNIPYKPDQIEKTGIRGLTPDLIEEASQTGKRWKLICSAEIDPNSPHGIKASVKPEMVGPESHFFHLEGTSAMIQITSDVLGNITLVEDNPSPRTTAYGMLADFINAVR
jgi:homoserine dehydrogenase